ncbi:DUF6571 family protein [Streptomyces sp. FXJ1.172]|uniref:DUF6571 family protein n=1 Tax=Streptomyces sp. FXJ1.172 TaxID=710705 RepID=UPI0007CF9DD1|nr:DUF6571 family protein [Streptomyces sp. FXJ1.172]WEO94938.1 hypothetical protein A6P39_013455 [Streptomyces sp. FXJ1.172]
MTLSFNDLVEVDLGKFATAVSDWKKAVDGLKKSAHSALTGMQAKSDSAKWAGVNAAVTREFIAKTAKEISDLHTEANSIYQVLEDGHTELEALQRQIRTTVQVDAPNLGVRVEDIGDGKVRCFFPHVRGDSDERTQEQLDQRQALESRINGILAHAAEIDGSVARALTKSHGNDPYNAGHSTYESLNDAEVERALELARKGDKMSDAELRELNQLLRFNSRERDGEFATEFYEGLGGPDKALQFYAKMSIDGTDADATKTRLDEVRDLQKVMGYTLADATDPDHKHHLSDNWGTEFRRLGTQQIGWEKGQWNKPYGYQVLGGLLRYGDYDSRFLNPIAEHITQLHKKDPYFFLSNKPAGSPDTYGFNPSGKLGTGNEPLNSVLEALGHSPEAAEKFFTDAPTAYNEDGTVQKDGKPGFDSYVDLLTDKDFEWTMDTNSANVLADEDKAKAVMGYGPDALGHALEAATTGLPYGSDAVSPPHSQDAANIFHKLVGRYGASPEDLDDSPLRDSLGSITADYMRDVQGAFMGGGDALVGTHGASAHLGNFNVTTNPEGLSPGMLKNFLGAVGKDPDAYGAIITSQESVTTDLVNDAFHNPDKYKELAPEIANRVHPGGEIAGIMAESRTQAVVDEKIAEDAAFNQGVATADKWAGRIIGMGIGKIPVGGEVAGWVVEDIQESVVENFTRDSTPEALKDRDAFLEQQQASSAQAIYDSTYTAAKEAGYDDANAQSQATAAKREIEDSYGLGRQRAGK